MPELNKNITLRLIPLLMGKYDVSGSLNLKTHLRDIDLIIVQKKADIRTYGFFKLSSDEPKLICRASYAFIPFKITLGTEDGLFILPTFRRKFFGAVNIIFFGLMIFVSLTFIAEGIAAFALAIGFAFLFFSILIISTIMEKKFLLRGIKKALLVKSN